MKKILLMLLVLGLVTGCSFNKDEEKNNSNTENNVQENDDNIVDDDNVDEDFQEYVYTTLDMEMYNKLSTPININTTSDLDAKKMFTMEITKFLEENNFDMQLAMQYFNIPEPLFNRIIEEIKRLPYASDSTKQILQNIINIESEKKVK